MIDEKTLQDRLTTAAEAQDTLLPRALADDLAAGRRRLVRRRLLSGASATVAVAAVAAAAVGLNGSLRDAADDQAPTATQEHAMSEAEAADAAAVSKIQAFDTLMTGLLVKHFDPAKKHLDLSIGPFQIDANVGSRGTSHKVGWKIAGERGEGMLLVQLSRSEKQAMNTCGSYSQPQLACHSLTLPNGRPAMIGHRGKVVELSYVQPDGEFAYLALDPLFGNNTDVSLSSTGITDAQLTAFVSDPDLNLPPLTAAQQAQEDQLKDFAPAPEVLETTAAHQLGGKLQRDRVDDHPGELSVAEKWTKGSSSATVEISLDAAVVASECQEQLSVPACGPVTLPNGGKGEYAEGARTYQGGPMYVMGATYVQPDGDLAAVRILYPGTERPKDAVTKAQILTLVADPALDK
ncbi:hypothetical protein [Kribbella sp. NPDC048928]|uniref:hypothetical protein n=1 Tax=Kribbella sp. NPDC048928 TaxID=3364111 RepID=UPI003723E6B3